IVGARLLNWDGTEQRGGRRAFLTPWRAMVDYARLWKIFPHHPYFAAFNWHNTPKEQEDIELPTVSGALMMLPRHAWEALGGLDAGYFLHVEDIDICLRAHKAGGTTLYCGSVSVRHLGGSSNTSRVFVEWHKTRGLMRYFHRHFSETYPAWGLRLVDLLLWIRWLAILPKLLWIDLKRWCGKQKERDAVSSLRAPG
ncbi:glycosyltransferase family 2 protein, partial [Candidatus Magnetaquicoccus inordinatus]|uniref:glycosyltransferase family 2 protein n=1 Tax=Candidatus Magnetaquicoccus inordinatus TaxID=2496818 RepID=UPI00102CF52F